MVDKHLRSKRWLFIKKFYIFAVFIIVYLSLSYILHIIKFLYFKGGFKLNFDFFTFFLEHMTYQEISLERRNQYQRFLVHDLLVMMKWNEFCFNINPNSIEFQQARILYQLELNFFLEKLNLNEFTDPNESLKCITEFYDHYLKIIELNNEVIKNISINEQYYNNYNTFCLFRYTIIFIIIIIKFTSYLVYKIFKEK